MSDKQLYRLRSASGREVIMAAEPEKIYVDDQTGEELTAAGKLLPLAPSPSNLPWSIENLRLCNWCKQPIQVDVNDCPACGRRMKPLE